MVVVIITVVGCGGDVDGGILYLSVVVVFTGICLTYRIGVLWK